MVPQSAYCFFDPVKYTTPLRDILLCNDLSVPSCPEDLLVVLKRRLSMTHPAVNSIISKDSPSSNVKEYSVEPVAEDGCRGAQTLP